MRRRDFLVMLGGAAVAWPPAARAQQPAMIGLLSPFTRADTEPWHEAFRRGLRKRGWVEGASVRFAYRYADGRIERLPELVAELIKLKVDVIVTAVTPDALAAELSRNPFGNPILVPVDQPGGAGPMMGGTYAATSDSRFGKATGVYGAIPIHDRFESWELYERMSR